jgi:hypothetical protein
VTLKGNVTPEVVSTGRMALTGAVTWSVTGASGQVVRCSSYSTRLTTSGETSCKVAPGQLSAANGPYVAMLNYSGDSKFSSSTQTYFLPVSLANTHTKLTVAPRLGSGARTIATATVTGMPSSNGTPTGL